MQNPLMLDFNDELRFPDLKGKVEVFIWMNDWCPMFLQKMIMMHILFRGICMQSSGYGKWNFRPMPRLAGSVKSLEIKQSVTIVHNAEWVWSMLLKMPQGNGEGYPNQSIYVMPILPV